MVDPHRVVIIGGGFGGLSVAKGLRRATVELTVVDRRNFHLFQPLLYQVATGGLSPANIASPIRNLVRHQRNTQVLLADVRDIDARERTIVLADGSTVPYDTLVVATGSRHHYFGHPEWESIAPGLKTLEDATAIRRRIFESFEAAERAQDAAAVRALLTFVIVGGGPTGVELAGTLAEIAHDTLRRDFRRFDPASARILLIEGSERILGNFPPDLSARAMVSLARLGVEVRTGALVDAIATDHVTLRTKAGSETVRAHTIVWAAGVKGSPLAGVLERTAGAELDRAGRVLVEDDLSLAGHSEIFVIGDLHCLRSRRDRPLPGVAPVAMQQGRYVARVIRDRLRGWHSPPFRYVDRGNMATIGRAAAVADFGWVRFGGYFAWLTWLFVHLMFLVGFQNKFLVMSQWAWNYITFNRSARLILHDETATTLGPR